MALKIESPAFTEADLDAFLAEARGRDRLALAKRLEAASARLAPLVARIGAPRTAPGGGWSAHEILSHVAVSNLIAQRLACLWAT